MDIGKEKETIRVEPLEEPFKTAPAQPPPVEPEPAREVEREESST